VSITQQFNTASSMGRLVLNVLLSFAQFEREIISVRISDKMSAARRKGKHLGGPPVLGYDLDRDRKRLVLKSREIPIVKAIFSLYLEQQSMLKVACELNRRGWHTKSHVTRTGKERPGHAFNKTSVQLILTNVTYIGQVAHKGETYPGEQPPIIEKATFEQAQQLIHANRHRGSKPYRHKHNALLKKMLRCGQCGCAMGHTFAKKGNRLYRYYLCTTRQKQGSDACDTEPLPAQQIEDCVVEAVKRIAQDPALREQAFAQTVAKRQGRRKRLESEHRAMTARGLSIQNNVDHLVSTIEKSGSPAASLLERLNREEEQLQQIKHSLDALTNRIAHHDAQTIERDYLLDALSRFGLLWDSLVESERVSLLRLIVQAVTFDPDTQEIAIRFRLAPTE